MDIQPSKKIQALGSYAFADVDKMVDALKEKGITPVDFGVGDPKDPVPEFVREALKASADKNATSGYPSYIGQGSYRQACSNWMKNRFGVQLNPDTEISSTLGSKEAIFNLKEGGISRPIETTEGLYLFELVRREPAHTESLEEARPRIEKMLLEKKADAALRARMQLLKNTYSVVTNPKALVPLLNRPLYAKK